MNETSVSTNSKTIFNVKQLSLVGLMTAIICVMAPWALPIPFSPVPISLGTLAIYFVLSVLGMKLGSASIIVYILLGLAGLPVFTGFRGGPGTLFGPTGGYIIGYIFMGLICGFFIDKWGSKLLPCLLGMILGTAALYVFGSFWLAFQLSCTLPQAFMAGAIPYIPGDLIKMIIAVVLGRQLRQRLKKSGLI